MADVNESGETTSYHTYMYTNMYTRIAMDPFEGYRLARGFR
jgi:hypothetical protein